VFQPGTNSSYIMMPGSRRSSGSEDLYGITPPRGRSQATSQSRMPSSSRQQPQGNGHPNAYDGGRSRAESQSRRPSSSHGQAQRFGLTNAYDGGHSRAESQPRRPSSSHGQQEGLRAANEFERGRSPARNLFDPPIRSSSHDRFRLAARGSDMAGIAPLEIQRYPRSNAAGASGVWPQPSSGPVPPSLPWNMSTVRIVDVVETRPEDQRQRNVERNREYQRQLRADPATRDYLNAMQRKYNAKKR